MERRDGAVAYSPPGDWRMDVCIPHPLDAGWQALTAGRWEDARAAFAASLREEETAAALEGLGWAAWWLNDVEETFRVRERAYQRFRDSCDDQAAARMAIVLAADHFLRRGEHAIANGWFQRAHHLLDGLEATPEHAMLGIWESYVAVIFHHDTAAARRLGARAREVAHALGAVDLEMLAQASLGFATVCEGEVERGMQLLDEATAAAVGGEMTDPDAIVTTCCYLISACERVRDFDRAAQWCERALRLAERWSYRFMFAYCRTHYASVLLWRGAWLEAESELAAATGELAATFPAMAAEGIARLVELRRRQGRLAEAHGLLDRLESQPLRTMGGNLALLGRGGLALDGGDAATAAAFAERFLRGVPTAHRLERFSGVELLARAQTSLGDHTGAAQTLTELRSIAADFATPPLLAATRYAEGTLSLAGGYPDAARHCFEDAVDLFERSASPYEAARARLELGRVLAALGRVDLAAREARVAAAILGQLGAVRDGDQAEEFLRQLAAAEEPAGVAATGGALTGRQVEILRLVAQGQSDKEIAAVLAISEHTVHRHIANILRAFDVPSRAAAVAQAVQRGLL
jgi:LuxR family maltose regulon positive regulatory protein